MFGQKENKPSGMFTKEFLMEAFDSNYNAAMLKADPMQRLLINNMKITMMQNEEILQELKKINEK